MRKFKCLGILGAALLIAPVAQAEPISWTLEGTVISVHSALSGTFTIGDSFKVEYTFESTTADSNGSANRGNYDDALTALVVTIDGTYTATGPGTNQITVDNDTGGADLYRIDILTPLSGASIGTYDLATLQTPVVQFRDPTATAISSDALFLTPPDPGDWVSGGTFLALQFNGPGGELDIASVVASIDSSSVTPSVPAISPIGHVSLAALVTLIGGFAINHRRTNRA